LLPPFSSAAPVNSFLQSLQPDNVCSDCMLAYEC
jgi:hypothetical protein